jgi:hypothetical protein
VIDLRALDKYRDRDWQTRLAMKAGQPWGPEDLGGCFRFPARDIYAGAIELRCMAANGEGWDHVSVTASVPRCPSWAEMDAVKRIFFKPEEVAMQLHVTAADHISHHPYCLHIWRPHAGVIPLPPKWMIA